MTGPLNAGEPVMLAGAITLFEGSTFCLSAPTGDVESGTAHGLFLRDTRVLSGWRLRLEGRPAELLSTRQPEAFAGRFVSRAAGLLVVRDRVVGDGMRETVTLENLGRQDAEVTLSLGVEADFADLFAVKEGRASGTAADVRVRAGELRLTHPDGMRGVSVGATGEPVVAGAALRWRVEVPAGASWSTGVEVRPVWSGRPVPAEHAGPRRRIRAWRAATTDITATDPALAAVLRRTESDLGALRMPGEFVAAGAPWFMTLFGRDSLLTAWLALPLDVGLALGTLRRLAETQGRRVERDSEEEPGRVMHELRRGPAGADLLGGERYYGTADASPLFVMLLAESWRWGADEAAVRALLPAADAALSWMDGYGDRDGDGFVEYQRCTERGLVNQGWKDSPDGINDAAGRVARPPVALCEVQGYGYAALLARAELAEEFGDAATAARLRDRAAVLRERFAAAFWLPARGWYAVALDGRKRPVDALTSNAAHCLWAGIATDEHAATLVERLAEPSMDSGFGLRTLAVAMGAFHPMSYHNGSVWPHDTAIAVAGLLRYRHVPGAVELAARLANGLLEAAAAFGGRLPELFCGFARDRFDPPVPYPTSCSPQAWASAAPLLLVRSLLGLSPHVPRRTLTLAPLLPARWGEVRLDGLRLGPATVGVRASGDAATVSGLPDGWTLRT